MAIRIDSRVFILATCLAMCLLTSCGSTDQSGPKAAEAWTPTTPQETAWLDAVTTFNEGLEADKGKSWTTATEKFVHALQSFQSVPGTEKEQASCMWRAGFAYQHLKDYDNATKSYKDAVVKFQAASSTAPAQQSEFIRHFQSKPDDPVSTMGFCYSNLGQIAGMNGNYRDAKANLEQAVALLGGIDNPAASTRGLLAHSYELLSLSLKQLGDSKGASDATAKATQLRSQ